MRTKHTRQLNKLNTRTTYENTRARLQIQMKNPEAARFSELELQRPRNNYKQAKDTLLVLNHKPLISIPGV